MSDFTPSDIDAVQDCQMPSMRALRFDMFFIALIAALLPLTGGLRIGVVGGGIGGCAASWFLRERLGSLVDITVYEPHSIGGRVQVVEVGGRQYEAGASIYHEKNALVQKFRKLFGLESIAHDDNGRKSGLHGADGMLFETSGWKIPDAAKAIWRYGLSPLRISTWVNNYVDRFSKIYDVMGNNCSYRQPVDLISAADSQLASMLDVTLQDLMHKEQFNEKFIAEIAGVAMRVNYNQGLLVPAFVGSISLAGVEGPLHGIKGGNFQIPQHLCQTASRRIHATVTEIQLQNSTTLRLRASGQRNDMRDFDYVILAAPLQSDSPQPEITFTGFPATFQPDKWTGTYRTTVATFVQGHLNYSYFQTAHQLDEIMNVGLNDVIASVSRLSDVSGGSDPERPVWKVFSSRLLKPKEIETLFPNYTESAVIDWRAYPDYLKRPEEPPPFMLFDNLYYVNAVEWLGSAMEMALTGAENVAIGIENRVRGRKPTCPVNRKSDRTEL